MAEPREEWTVLPHGPLTAIDDSILTVTGTVKMPIGEFERRMTVVRLASGELVIFLTPRIVNRAEALGR